MCGKQLPSVAHTVTSENMKEHQFLRNSGVANYFASKTSTLQEVFVIH